VCQGANIVTEARIPAETEKDKILGSERGRKKNARHPSQNICLKWGGRANLGQELSVRGGDVLQAVREKSSPWEHHRAARGASLR